MKNSSKQEQEESSSEIEEYTEKEIEALDKYQEYSNRKFLDEEIYDIIIKYNYNDEKIKSELDQMKKDLKKGDEYEWHEITKSKKIFF